MDLGREGRVMKRHPALLHALLRTCTACTTCPDITQRALIFRQSRTKRPVARLQGARINGLHPRNVSIRLNLLGHT